MIREARPSEYPAVGNLRVAAYQALGLLPAGSDYVETLRGFGFDGDSVVLVATDHEAAELEAAELGVAEHGAAEHGAAGLGAAEHGAAGLGVAGEVAGGILGTITLELFGPASELARDATEADVRAFAVDPRAQGRGVGRELLHAVIEHAAKHGVSQLRLCTQPAMRGAQHLYETTGFTRTPELDWSPVPGLLLRAYELALPL